MKLRYLPRYFDHGGDRPEDDYLTITTGKSFLAVVSAANRRTFTQTKGRVRAPPDRSLFAHSSRHPPLRTRAGNTIFISR